MCLDWIYFCSFRYIQGAQSKYRVHESLSSDRVYIYKIRLFSGKLIWDLALFIVTFVTSAQYIYLS